jgi:hypothetical protein
MPFAASIVAAAVLFCTRFMALAVWAAFVTAVALVLRFSFESLTVNRYMQAGTRLPRHNGGILVIDSLRYLPRQCC